MSSIHKVSLCVPEEELEGLRRRLAGTRWADAPTASDWSQGVPLSRLRALCERWAGGYDWRRCEAMLNRFGLYATEIEGLRIHFLHIRSPRPNALPLLLTHGWPGSIIEFHRVIEPLAGGERDGIAFDLVIPCLPGFGFSEKPKETGWTVQRIARAWISLMARLGYERYAAQGGDWGAAVTVAMAKLAPSQLAGIHLNMPLVIPPAAERGAVDAEEQRALHALERFRRDESAYARVQATRPQTLGYGLVDSPVAQAAWIYEKFYAWSDCEGDPDALFTTDALLDNIMLYWLPAAGASSARLYWESFRHGFAPAVLDVPVGCSIFPREIIPAARRWAEKYYRNLFYWNKLDRGGHFAAFEQPGLFVEEMRQCFSRLP